MTSAVEPRPATTVGKAVLAARIWCSFVRINLALARHPMPDVVRRLSEPSPRAARVHHPARLSRAVSRSLRFGRRRPRCLVTSLVLYRLLCADGYAADLVIGLPPGATGHEAHAWVELDGRDVGPPPGRSGHAPLARFP